MLILFPLNNLTHEKSELLKKKHIYIYIYIYIEIIIQILKNIYKLAKRYGYKPMHETL